VKSGEKERERETRERGGKGRFHSCGRSEATEAAGFGIPARSVAAAGGGRVWRFWAFGVEAFAGLEKFR
jgi:hypothetical protein